MGFRGIVVPIIEAVKQIRRLPGGECGRIEKEVGPINLLAQKSISSNPTPFGISPGGVGKLNVRRRRGGSN